MKNKSRVIIAAALLIVAGLFFYSQTSQTKNMSKSQGVSPTTEAKKTYSLDEVSKHNQKNDCWMAIEGKVYDVTKFIPEHPGGESIINGCGKDATKLFNERPTNQRGPHPDAAKAGLEKLYIGELVN